MFRRRTANQKTHLASDVGESNLALCAESGTGCGVSGQDFSGGHGYFFSWRAFAVKSQTVDKWLRQAQPKLWI
jgi:hypothetical protein